MYDSCWWQATRFDVGGCTCAVQHGPLSRGYMLSVISKKTIHGYGPEATKNLHSVTDMHLATPSPRDDATVVVVVVVVTLLPLRAPPYAAWVRAIIFLFSRRSNHDFSDNI